MATLEERVQALEQENAELKQKIELHTIAISGLVNKTMLEVISGKNDKIFKALEDHDKFTNMQIAELRGKVEDEIEGKIVGMQTEMRQQFAELDGKIVGHQTETRQHFTQIETALAQILARLPEKP